MNNIKSSITAFFDSKIDASGNWKSAPKEIDAAILAYAFPPALPFSSFIKNTTRTVCFGFMFIDFKIRKASKQ
jgi:hypothetical protein